MARRPAIVSCRRIRLWTMLRAHALNHPGFGSLAYEPKLRSIAGGESRPGGYLGAASSGVCNHRTQSIRPESMRLATRGRLGQLTMGLAVILVLMACTASITPAESPSGALITAALCSQPSPTAPSVALDGIEPEHLILCDLLIQTVQPGPASLDAPNSARSYRTATLSSSQRATLLALLQSPSELGNPCANCPAPQAYVAPIYLQLTDGRIILPKIPTDSCGQPPAELIQLLHSLQFTEIGGP
jgi:hypothetical protein